MSFESEQALRAELGRGERLLWSGQPRQGLRLRAGDALMVPFSLMWGGFAFFWEYTVLAEGAPWFFALWGIPFVLAGIYIIAGRFFVDSRLRARTYYGLTDQRVLIVSGLRGRGVKSLDLQGLNDIALTERADRSGSIAFGPSPALYGIWSGTQWLGMARRLGPSFELLDDVRMVYDLVRHAQNAARGKDA